MAIGDAAPTLAQYEAWSVLWPAADAARMIPPVRCGMDRNTGKMLVGWNHVLQSMGMIFETRYHERILRQWAGSFVPMLLGRNITQPTITKFWWSITAALDLWEPDYAIKQIYMAPAPGTINFPPTTAAGIRSGAVSFMMQGVYMPYGTQGNFTPDNIRSSAITASGTNAWRVAAGP